MNSCTSDPPLPSRVAPDVPAGFDAWLRRALAREPANRFQSAAELTDALSSICGVEARLGGAPSGREPPVARVSSAKPAVTASALSRTSVPTARTSRPKPIALGLLFVVVMAGAVVGGRAVLSLDFGGFPDQ